MSAEKLKPGLPDFGIDFGKGIEFNPRTRKTTRRGVVFLREALSCLGEEKAIALVHFLSLYVKKEIKSSGLSPFMVHRNFACLSEVVLREVVGWGKTFREVSIQDQVAPAVQVERSFHFWLETLSFIFPEIELSLPEKFGKRASFQNARTSAELALARGSTALRMAKAIGEEQERLQALGVSPLAFKLWAIALLGLEDKLPFLEEKDRQELDRFRRIAPNHPAVVTLSKLRERLLTRLLLQRKKKPLNLLVDLFKALPSAKQGGADYSFISALRWLGKKSEKKREETLAALFKAAGRTDFKKIDLPNDHLSPKKRAGYLQAILKILARLYEKEGDSVPVLNRLKPNLEKARTLIALAQLNFDQWGNLLSGTVGERFKKIVQASNYPNFSLSEGNILTILLVMSKKPFDPYEFRQDLKDVKELEEFFLMLESRR